MKYDKIEAISPSNISRWKSIALWLKDEEFNFLDTVRKIIVADKIENAFKYFVKNIENVDDVIIVYVLDRSFTRYGKIACCTVLFRLIFGKYITPSIRKASRRIKQQITKEERRKVSKYKKIVKYNNRDITIEFQRKGTRFYQVSRDVKTGRYTKVPKKFKINAYDNENN